MVLLYRTLKPRTLLNAHFLPGMPESRLHHRPRDVPGDSAPRSKSIMKSRRDEFEEDRELLMEIRRDRARRLSGGQGANEGADVARDEEA